MDNLIKKLQELFAGDSSGHDFAHTFRVYQTAMHIADAETCNREVVALGALLHDCDDRKLFQTEDYANARRLLEEYGASEELKQQVIEAIKTVSFSGASQTPATIEGKIIQDADRLDALGAVGIARTFAYGGAHGTPMYDPQIPPRMDMTPQQYRNHHGTSLNHFYEKLFTLKDTMNTQTAKGIAQRRDAEMHRFVEAFLAQWTGEDL